MSSDTTGSWEGASNLIRRPALAKQIPPDWIGYRLGRGHVLSSGTPPWPGGPALYSPCSRGTDPRHTYGLLVATPPFMGGGDVVGISSSLSGVRGRESAFSGSPLLPREGEGGFTAVGTGQARVGCLSGIAGTIGPHQTGGGAPWIRLSCNRITPYATTTGAKGREGDPPWIGCARL